MDFSVIDPNFVGQLIDYSTGSAIIEMFVGPCDSLNISHFGTRLVAWLQANPIGGWVEIASNSNAVVYCYGRL